MIRTKFQNFNFHAFVSPSTFIRKTDIEIKDKETQTSKEKPKIKRGRNKERTHKKLKQTMYLRERNFRLCRSEPSSLETQIEC